MHPALARDVELLDRRPEPRGFFPLDDLAALAGVRKIFAWRCAVCGEIEARWKGNKIYAPYAAIEQLRDLQRIYEEKP